MSSSPRAPFAHAARFPRPLPVPTVLRSGIVLLLVGLSAVSGARNRPHVETDGASVRINRQTVLRFQASEGGKSPTERALIVAERLQAQAANTLSAGEVQARGAGKQWRIVLVGKTVLLSVTRQDARRNSTSPEALAFRWAAQLRHALAMPPVSLSATRLVVPLGESRALTLGGYEDAAFESRVDGPECVTLESQAAARRLLIRGVQTGKTVVRAQVGDEAAACVVVVKRYAGHLPTDLRAEVTGRPVASPELIARAAALALRGTPCEPGASLQILTPVQTRRATHPGESQTLTARVTIRGGDCLPVTGIAQVRVVNRVLPARDATHLLYSNEPEHITRTGTLYATELTGSEPARIMFHHDNQLHGAAVLAVTLANPTDHSLRFHLVSGFVAPGVNPAGVGYQAGRVFLRNWLKQRGEICTLPPHATLPLVLQRLSRRQTASGIAQIQFVDTDASARCLLLVSAFSPGDTGFPRSAQAHLDPWHFTLPRPMTDAELARADGRLPLQPNYRASRTLDARYIVGQKWTFVPLGLAMESPKNPSLSEENRDVAGDYGVLYNIHITLQNPLSTPQKVEMAFGPGGGPAMAVFTVGGDYCEIHETRPPEQRPIARFTLRPNETRTVTLQTVPLGGSSYPANVIIR